MTEHIQWIEGIVVEGAGIASGKNQCKELGGSIRPQKPFFELAGIDISKIHDGTLNIDISPYQYAPLRATVTIRDIKWHPTWNAEDFSLFACLLSVHGKKHKAYVYYPHPDKKPTAFYGHGIAEILTEYIPDIPYGTPVRLGIDTSLLTIQRAAAPQA